MAPLDKESTQEGQLKKGEPFKNADEILLALEYLYKNKGMLNDYKTQAKTTFETFKDLVSVFNGEKKTP